MGLKFAHAMGARTVLFTTSPGKAADARRLGADEVVVSANPDEMKRHADSFDFILDTVAAPHNLDALTALLKRDATLCLVGAPAEPHPSPAVFNLVFRRRQIAGSLIGGIRETQEMLDFCGKHGITSDIEMIKMQDINVAYERMLKSDVKYRFVIDMESLALAGECRGTARHRRRERASCGTFASRPCSSSMPPATRTPTSRRSGTSSARRPRSTWRLSRSPNAASPATGS